MLSVPFPPPSTSICSLYVRVHCVAHTPAFCLSVLSVRAWCHTVPDLYRTAVPPEHRIVTLQEKRQIIARPSSSALRVYYEQKTGSHGPRQVTSFKPAHHKRHEGGGGAAQSRVAAPGPPGHRVRAAPRPAPPSADPPQPPSGSGH